MKIVFGLVLLCAVVVPALADITALVAIEPTSRKDGHMLSRAAMESGLGKLLGQTVSVTTTEDLTQAMQSTRTADYDVFIGPAQVAASAIARGYELLGSTEAEEQYLLVARSSLNSVAELRQGRVYLPQRDSIYTYMARGLLTASGLSFKDLSKIDYARYPQAGLAAINLRMFDATMVRRDEWEVWSKENPGVAKVLATSGPVPGGFSVAIKKELAPEVRAQLGRWFAGSARSAGMKLAVQHADLSHYRSVAELGTFTPTSLPGIVVVDSVAVKNLISQGAVIVDTRSEKEFKHKHIPGAIFVPYHEKSLKDVVYDSALDDFSGVKVLDKTKPTIFHCNGAECWKSYKASRTSLAMGFSKVYWYRGGIPEWESSGQKVVLE